MKYIGAVIPRRAASAGGEDGCKALHKALRLNALDQPVLQLPGHLLLWMCLVSQIEVRLIVVTTWLAFSGSIPSTQIFAVFRISTVTFFIRIQIILSKMTSGFGVYYMLSTSHAKFPFFELPYLLK
jgi:hypothetical protein